MHAVRLALKEKSYDAKLLANAGEGKKKKINLGKLPMIQADSQFLMIQRRAFFNGLKKNSLWEVTDYLKQQRSAHRSYGHTEVDAKGTEPVKCSSSV